MIIDAHIHLGEPHEDFLTFLESLDLKLINVCVAKDVNWREQAVLYRELSRKYTTKYAWCTSCYLLTKNRKSLKCRVD